MDDMDMPERSGAAIQNLILNALTALVLGASGLVGLVFALLFVSPNNAFNPFPPPTLPAVAQFPTPTNTSEFPTLPPTWTLTPTFASSSTLAAPLEPSDTPAPPDTVTSTATPGATLTATRTASPTATATPTGPTPTPSRTRSALSFTLQGDAPVALSNFANTDGCNWLGIAGQAFDLAGKPIAGLIVHLEGGGQSLDSLTGSAPAYGSGGYELPLGNHPVATEGVYRVQLLNTSGQPLSDVVVVDTFADCSKNLLLVNFVQNH